jgi:hypothetical protein
VLRVQPHRSTAFESPQGGSSQERSGRQLSARLGHTAAREELERRPRHRDDALALPEHAVPGRLGVRGAESSGYRDGRGGSSDGMSHGVMVAASPPVKLVSFHPR